jgi:hypothetical protein
MPNKHGLGAELSPMKRFTCWFLCTICLAQLLFVDGLHPVNGLQSVRTNAHVPVFQTRTTHSKALRSTTGSEENVSEDHINDVLSILTPHPSDVTRMSGTDLAYIGDVVFELFVRSRYVWPPKKTSILQTTVVECVRGKIKAS